MLETIVERIVNKIIGEYVEAFSSDNLHIGIWKGEVVVRNVRLKKDIIKRFNLPFNVKYSRLGCLKMNIPWSSLGSSKIEVSIEGLELMINEIAEEFWECKNHRIIEERKKQIEMFCEAIIADFASKTKASKYGEEEQGYFGTMGMKIIDNLQIVVKDIHVRFEDDISKEYSFGMTLEELKIFTVNKKDEPEFIDRTKKTYENEPLRKRLILVNLAIYWNESSDFFNERNPEEELSRSIFKTNGENNMKMNHLILMSFNAMLYQRERGKQYEEPEINLFIKFKELKIEISNQQLQQIVTLVERFQRFSNEIKVQNRKKLTQLEMIANRELFLKLFPNFFQKKSTESELKQIEEILSKMEAQNFEKGIREYLQGRQKEKMIQERMEKTRGWFSGPKELTQEEIEEIEKILIENFGVETRVVKRPENFYYIRVNFNLDLLEFTVVNKGKQIIKEGLKLVFDGIKMEFNLREGGYMLDFGMKNINLDLFEIDRNVSHLTNFVKTISNGIEKGGNQDYVRLQVFGSPLHKKYLDTEIFLKTEELLIQFDPKIIKIAKDFVNIKLSPKNEEAALEAYGELKNKATTAANTSLNKPFVKKSFISLDVTISAISLILYFQPSQPDSDIWILKLGQTRIFSDPEILKIIEFREDEPMEKYGVSLSKISFMHFESKDSYFSSRLQENDISNREKVFNDLGIDIELQLFKDSFYSEQIPRIRAKTVLHNIDIYLTDFIYDSLQKIGDCFSLPEVKDHSNDKKGASSKSEVMKGAKKIGVVFEQGGLEQKKYIAVLNGSYLYMYKDKKDIEYSDYFFIKNCKIETDTISEVAKKPYQVTFKNTVNVVKLGFEKKQIMDEWIESVKVINQEKEEEYKELIEEFADGDVSPLLRKPSQIPLDCLNFELCASIEQACINTLFPDEKWVKIGVNYLETKILIFEAKNIIDLSLKSIQIEDNIYNYLYEELNAFLYSTAIQNKEKLIEISLINYDPIHPKYNMVDLLVNFEFGKLICNYKPETMERVMNFFIPKDGEMIEKKKEKGAELTLEEKAIFEKEKKERKKVLILKEINESKPERFFISINIKIEEVSISLVNRKNRVMFSKMGLTGFDIECSVSLRRIILNGKLKEVWVGDYSRYPYTIYLEENEYKNVHYLIGSYNNKGDMLTFNIELVEIENEKGKTMFIKTEVSNLKVSYIQQPVLRIISYLLEQILPSLTPPEDLSQPKVIPKNDTKPLISNMELLAEITNILAVVEPRTELLQESLELNVSHIVVTNSNSEKEYIRERKESEEAVLVETYIICMEGIRIVEKLKGSSINLTNNIKLNVYCDLIQNPQYYYNLYQERFSGGMRIKCDLSEFLMSINHDDYNFMMKCLYWNITYDDNAEGYFVYGATQQNDKAIKKQFSEPLYFELGMSKIILCVTENNFPLSVLLLNQMNYTLTLDDENNFMIFKMKHLYGTTLSKIDKFKTLERGMFNSFGYEKIHMTKDLEAMDLDLFVDIFSRNELIMKDSVENVVHFQMNMGKITKDSIINIKIKDLGIAIELNTLLILSKLALIEDYIQPPKSSIQPIDYKPDSKEQIQNGGDMQINIEMRNFLGCLGDKSFENYIIMEGAFNIKIRMNASTSEEAVLAEAKLSKASRINSSPLSISHKFRDINSYTVKIENYSLYFCNVNDLKNKRYILLPLGMLFELNEFYGKFFESVYRITEIDGMISQVQIECSLKDMITINNIIQENLATLNENKKPDEKKNEIPEEARNGLFITSEEMETLDLGKENDAIPSIDGDALKKAIKPLSSKIKTKVKGAIKLEPIEIRVVNDCGNNFMPVLCLGIDSSTLLYSSNVMTRLAHCLTIELHFFNPRSASWEPIIETFKLSLNYDSIVTEFGKKSKIIIGNTENEEVKELRLNISTQLIHTLMATFEIAQKQKESIKEFLNAKNKDDQEDIEVSPYHFHNYSNYEIKIFRSIYQARKSKLETEVSIKPLFKGPINLGDKPNILEFEIRNRKHEVSMQKFGITQIPGISYLHMEFKIDKLNRIISFVDKYTIRNGTNTKMYCIRYRENREKLEDYLELQPQDVIPVKGEWYVQFSFGLKTFTPICKVDSLSVRDDIKAESEKFKISLSKRQTVLSHVVMTARAPFIVENCLPKNIKLQFISNGKFVSTREIDAQSLHEVFANESLSCLKFKLTTEGFYWSDEFWYDENKKDEEQLLIVKDLASEKVHLKIIFHTDIERKQTRLNIFCPAFIISELEEDIIIYGNLEHEEKEKTIEKYYPLAGQTEYLEERREYKIDEPNCLNKVTFVGVDVGSKLRICGSGCLIDFSEPFSISSIGIHQSRAVVEREVYGKKENVFTMLALDIQLKKMTKTSNIFSKQITIKYRYIISNTTKFDIFIREEESKKKYFYINRNEKKPFYFMVPSLGLQSRKMIIRTTDSEESLPLVSNTLGNAYFKVELSREKGNFLYFKLITQEIDSYLFYEIREVRYEDLPYQILVKSDKLTVFIPHFDKVMTKNSVPLLFINELPEQSFNFLILIQLVETQQSLEVLIETDNINFKKSVRFMNPISHRYSSFLVQVVFSDSRKFIIINDLRNEIEAEIKEYEKQSIHIKLEKLSLSFIQNHREIAKPYEAFYFYLHNLELAMIESNLVTRYQTRLQFLQFDQMDPYNIPDPVILTPQKYKQFMFADANKKLKQSSIFNLLIIVDNSFIKNTFFNLITVDINNLVVRASTYFIKLLISIVKEYNDVFRKESEFLIQKQLNTWKKLNLPSDERATFIKAIQIAPFTVEISSEVRLNELDIESVLFFGTIINALGVVITNIEGAPITLEGISLSNCIDTLQGIQQKLMEHYKSTVLKQLYKIFGSLNIIGNPVSLFKNISTGFKALKEKPAEGFVEGPLEFGLGVVGGTSSLIAHSVGGVLNSVEKMTGTFASGLAVLTFDKEFEENREKEKMKKPRHLFEGLEKGGKAVFTGFKEGITGVITKPIEHTRKSGVAGFFKGTAQGVAGLIIKPVTGVVDFASKTTEGLKNTALYLEDKPNENRIREPRVLYSECSVIRDYDYVDSKLWAIMNKTKYEDRYGFEDVIFLRSFVVTNAEFLVVLDKYIAMINVEREKVEWAIPLDHLIFARESHTKIKIAASSRREWYTKKVDDIIELKEQGDLEIFMKLVEDLMVNRKQIYELKIEDND